MSFFPKVAVAIALCGLVDARTVANADDPRQILIDREARHRTLSDEHTGELVVTAANGKVRRKQWKSYREGSGANSSRLIRFISPPDVRGVGYLLRQRAGKPPDEWLYLPSMKRERRIVQTDRQSAFVGTDFSYEDLETFDPSTYTLALLPERIVDAHASYAIELRPRGRSEYDRKVMVIRKDDLRLLSVDYYRQGDTTISKRLTITDYQMVDGHLYAMKMEMADLHKGSSTAVLISDVKLDRPQPADRYTIQNLLREGVDGAPLPAALATRPAAIGPRANIAAATGGAPTETSRPLFAASFEGYAEAKVFGFLGASPGSPNAEGWADAFGRTLARIGPVRITASVRAEQSSSVRVGPVVWDPADRLPDRSPLSIRELSAVIPIASGIDFQAGRFYVAWGQSEELSPADAFLPRDISDPLTTDRLPLWGYQLRGERHGIRFDVFVEAITTPWRLPAMNGQHSPLSQQKIFFENYPSTVPKRGFGAARVSGMLGRWDVGAWARTGVRPAPILELHTELATTTDEGTVIPVGQRYADETGGGLQIAHEVIGWLVRGEVAVLNSSDADLGRAVIGAVSLSHPVRNGLFVGTFAFNGITPPVEPLLLFDRALLPAFLLGVRQSETWGAWKLGWLGTFDRIGGVLTADVTKDLTPVVKLTVGADLPHGDPFSPARVFAGDKRLRAAIRWDW